MVDREGAEPKSPRHANSEVKPAPHHSLHTTAANNLNLTCPSTPHTNVQKEAAWIIIRATQETQILETIVQTSTLTARSVAVQRVHPLPTCFGPRPVTRFKTTHQTMVTHFVSTLPGNCYCSDGTRGGTQPYPSSCQRIV